MAARRAEFSGGGGGSAGAATAGVGAGAESGVAVAGGVWVTGAGAVDGVAGVAVSWEAGADEGVCPAGRASGIDDVEMGLLSGAAGEATTGVPAAGAGSLLDAVTGLSVDSGAGAGSVTAADPVGATLESSFDCAFGIRIAGSRIGATEAAGADAGAASWAKAGGAAARTSIGNRHRAARRMAESLSSGSGGRVGTAAGSTPVSTRHICLREHDCFALPSQAKPIVSIPMCHIFGRFAAVR